MDAEIVILCADTYGGEFFRRLIRKLKDERLIPNLRICTDRFYGPCNAKLEKQLEVFDKLRGINRFLVFADSEGCLPDEVHREVERHVCANLKTRTKIIILEYEIEVWVCTSENIVVRNCKPSDILKNKEGYEKYRLPQYADNLNIDKLRRESDSFRQFLEFVQHAH